MLLNVTEYHRPETIAEAVRLLARPGIKTAALAGGTLLVGQRDDELRALVDLRALGLNTISEQGSQMRFGAMLTLQALVDSPLARAMVGGILVQAAGTSAARLIRNAATIGGTLASGPAANADLPVALAALDAQARLIGQAERLVPAETVFEERQPGELLVEIIIERPPAHAEGAGARATIGSETAGTGFPQAPAAEGAFVRVARAPDDVALVHAAAFLLIQSGICQQARVAVGGAGMASARLHAAESLLAGQSITQEHIAAAVVAGIDAFAPPPDFRASPAYRRDVAATLARRALEQCADAARWKQLMGNNKA
ncbi:MAG TPA: FAD binding domain-containing protein [Ktedonobacterales bacterium]|jgi:carbon-monoxide dehydrogenase medium subunit